MGGYATLHFGIRHPERALSLVVAGCGYGSVAAERAQWKRDVEATAERFLTEPMAALADVYCQGPDAGPVPGQGSEGLAGVPRPVRGPVRARPRPDDAGGPADPAQSVYELERELEGLTVPTLIVTGDEDEPCLEPGIYLKRKIRTPRIGGHPQVRPHDQPRGARGVQPGGAGLPDRGRSGPVGAYVIRSSQTGSVILPLNMIDRR